MNSRSKLALKALLLAVFVALGLARPIHARAAGGGPAGEGVSGNLPLASATGSGGGGLIGVDEATGSATASIPFDAPPARGVSMPSLGLTYSAGVDGVAGYGWDLQLPAIERTPLSRAPRGDLPGDVVPSTLTDRFTFGGDVLVPLCLVGTSCQGFGSFASWANGWYYYRLQNDASRARVFRSPGMERWRVEYSSGEIEDYGSLYGDLSAVDRFVNYGAQLVPPPPPNYVFRWNIVRRFESARPKNYIAFRWVNDATHPEYLRGYLSDVYYTPTLDAPLEGSPYNATFASHVHFEYDRAPQPGFHKGWQGPGGRRHAPPRTYRLSHVDVSSAPLDDLGPRSQVRRYWLTYEEHGPKRSLLTQVATEGSKDSSGNGTVEDASGRLPPSPTLSMGTTGMTLEYTQRTYASAPVEAGVVPSGNAATIVKDINGDGLPDLLRPADSVIDPGGAQGSNAAVLGHWSAADHRTVFQDVLPLFNYTPNPYPACPIDAASFLADGSQSAIGEFSGRNETLALFHGSLQNCLFVARLPIPVGAYFAFTLRAGQDTIDPSASEFDIQHSAGDVDGDGLLDLVARKQGHSDPKAGDLLLAGRKDGVGRLSGGLNVDWGDTVSTAVGFADMDGDGCADEVFVPEYSGGDLFWRASECNGWFYQSQNGINAGAAAPNSQLADVDGDGLADLVTPVGTTISIKLNSGDGRSFGGSGREVSFALPAQYQVPFKLTFADMNASGTTDVVVITRATGRVLYFDLLEGTPGAARPEQLKSITNGLGAKTTVSYARGAELDDQFAWSTHSRAVFDVVRTVETTGSASGVSSSAYFYYDPVYDGWNQRARGFRRVRVRTAASTDGSAIQHQHRVTYYAIGSCGTLDDECPLSRDPEKDTLTTLRLPYRVDVFGDDQHFASLGTDMPATTIPMSTTLTSYALATTRSYLDFRTTTQVRVEQVDTVVYDPNGTVKTIAGTIAHGSIGVGTEALTPVTLSSPTSSVSMKGDHLRSRFEYDAFGNPTVVHDDGRVSIDRTIDATADWMLAPGSVWTWRVAHTRVPRWTPSPGDRPSFDREMTFDYDASGRVLNTHAYLDGVVSLDRHHENPSKSVAPAPPDAAKNGWFTVAQATYDVFGNLDTASDSTGGCRSWKYDKAYGAVPVQNSNWLGGCGTGTELTTTTLWDRGLGLPLRIEHPDGRVGAFAYDAFGRLEDAFAPDPQTIGLTVLAAHFHYYDPASGEVITPARVHATGPGVDTWSYLDGFGKAIWSLHRADPTQGDGGAWTVDGYFSHASDRELRQYDPWFYSGDPLLFVGQGVENAAYTRSLVDPFGRTTMSYDRDGTLVGSASYRGLVSATTDEAGHVVTTSRDGHGRVLESRSAFGTTQRVTGYTYLATGEVTQIREYPANAPTDATSRWMAYDSLGHLVENGEPNSTKNYDAPTQIPWRYAYDLAGRMVGTSDARGCGKNLSYDTLGRATAEDWSPCLDSQPDYTAPSLATGDGTEQFSVYDTPEAGQSAPAGAWAYRGHLVATYDRGAHTQIVLDGRSRAVSSTRWIAAPGPPASALAARYAPHAYRKDVVFDLAERLTSATTGADVAQLMVNGQSATSFNYTARGVLGGIGSSYGDLAGAMTYDASGQPLSVVYHDRALTTGSTHYDARRRVDHYQLLRGPSANWSDSVSNGETIPTKLADDAFHYDAAGDLHGIDDLRAASEWSTGSKPVSRTFGHDQEHRLKRVDYTYPSGVDSQVAPFAAEESASSSSPVPRAFLSTRPVYQSYDYDAHGRPSAGDDDLHAPWDRSLSAPVFSGSKPHALTSAANGKVIASYDDAGNATRVDLDRLVSCSAPSGKCAQVFAYDWDEVGHLTRARRWDVVTIASTLPAESPVADLRYTYSGDARVVRENRSTPSPSYFVDVFSTLRLQNTTWDGTDYVRSQYTEAVYLTGFARLIDDPTLPHLGTETRHVVFTFGDVLGSTSSVVDGVTGELMERATYQAMGAADSDYRPARWGAFRESYRFTGKEDDVEVGLQYFGARYYAPNLGRWLSPDPLMVHGVGPELDVYSYVGGRADSAVDPNGLCWGSLGKEGCAGGEGGGLGQIGFPSFEWGSNDSGSGGKHIDGWVPGGQLPYTATKNVSVSYPGANVGSVSWFGPATGLPWLPNLPQGPLYGAYEGHSGVVESLADGALVALAVIPIAAGGWVILAEVATVGAALPAIGALLVDGEIGAAMVGAASHFSGTIAIAEGIIFAVNDPLSLGGGIGGGGANAAEAGAIRVASGGGASASATLVREIQHGESVANLIQEAATLTYESGGLEHAVISTQSGQRLLLQGGAGGMSFEGFAVRRVLGHTHPVPTGPSAVDFVMLQQTGQRSSWIYELFGGGLTRFRSP
ncbi:hypothetical protein BH09MYX1_BH09MYX1_32750 [soil metagenome]